MKGRGDALNLEELSSLQEVFSIDLRVSSSLISVGSFVIGLYLLLNTFEMMRRSLWVFKFFDEDIYSKLYIIVSLMTAVTRRGIYMLLR